MNFFKLTVFSLLLFFQSIQSLESTLLDKNYYYAACLENLNNLHLTDYNELLTEVENSLDVKSSHPSLEQLIIDIAQVLLNRSISSEEISCINGEPGSGLSGNPIFKVGHVSQPSLVVKAFKGSCGEFSKEFLTLYTYNQNKLSDLKFPQVQGIGVTYIGKDRYFLIAMQFVEGITINDLFIKIFLLEENSKERNHLISLLQKLYTKMGKGLAQFHYQKPEIDQPIPSIHLQNLEKLLCSAFAFLNSRSEGKNLAKQLQIVAKSNKWLQIIHQHYDLGYMHADVHPGNFIVNLESGSLYLIDTGTETIGSQGTPIGLPFLDIAQIYNQLSLRKLWGLSDTEIDLLYSSFVHGYKSQTDCFPTDKQMAFFQIVDMFKFFVWYDLISDKLDNKSQKIIGDIYKYRLKSCLSILNDFSGLNSGHELLE